MATKRSIIGLMSLILITLSSLAAEADGPQTFQLAAIVSWISGDNDVYGKFSNIGPGVRLDINLTNWLMISPEISYLPGEDGSLSFGGTVNGRLGLAYAGLGVAALNQTSLIFFQDPGVTLTAFWKLQAGLKGRHWLVSLSYVTDGFHHPWLQAFGLSAGYVF
jgi:hypothetical protein